MFNWYYSQNGQQLGPVSELQLRSLFESGKLDGETLVWREGMEEWLAASSALDNLPVVETAICCVSGESCPVSEMIQYGDKYVSPACKEQFVQTLSEGDHLATPVSNNGYFFNDPTGVARITKILFIAGTALQIPVSLLFMSASAADAEANTYDMVIGLLSLVMVPIYIAGVVFYCIWKVRCAKNCRVWSNRAFHFTPGWSVGFYFIPIVMLWKPYQAMREIWDATFEGSEKREQTGVVGWWWGLYIVTNLISNLSTRAEWQDFRAMSFWSGILYAALSIPLLLVIIRIIDQITAGQKARVGDSSI